MKTPPNIVGHAWFCGITTLGVVIIQDKITKEFKSYIGVGGGVDESLDLLYIASYGSSFPLSEAITLCLKEGTLSDTFVNTYVTIPVEPPESLLISMAIRYDHALGLDGYYDQFDWKGTHAKKFRSTVAQMRQLYEEVSGAGFYRAGHNDQDYLKQYGHNLLPSTGEDGV